MGVRRQAREAALQMLYLCDNCKFPSQEVSQEYFQTLLLQSAGTTFAHQIFLGTVKKIDALDKLIMKYAENWELRRMAAIDRNILRLAAYEIVEMPETPINVIIDEAVEIAKKYSTLDSGKFVNGILDKLKNSRKQAETKPAEKGAEEKHQAKAAG
jgi:transcription antitermination protein NusB